MACVFLATGITAFAQPGLTPIPTEDLSAIQHAVERLVTAVNNRDAKAADSLTVSTFDARGEGFSLDRAGRPRFGPVGGGADDRYKGVEIAALVRGARLITSDVALAEGFFRTTGMPGGADAAGALMVTLVKRDGRWLAATARFGAFRFSDGSTFMVRPPWTPSLDHRVNRLAAAGEWITDC